MTREQFDALVRRIERQFDGRAAALRGRLVLLAVVGYLGLLAWVGLILLISAAFFTVMIWAEPQGKIVCGILGGIVFFGGGYAALRALLVRVPDPVGRAVTRAEAPELFAMLDSLQRQLRAPAFHRVLVQHVCNAAVVQVPRLGVLGWHRNYLLLGLPLLDGLSGAEFRAVLAHECAHLSRQHGRLSHWLYRLRRSWEEIFNQLSRPRVRGEFSLRPVVVKFVEWFWPRFNAHAFVLSRANEYEADEQSARLAGKESAASALLRINLVARQLDEKVWPELLQLANVQPAPPDDVFVRLREALRAGIPTEEAARWQSEGLQMASTNADTHPCLTERLRALSALPAGLLAPPPHPSAAEALLGPSLETIRRDVQKAWSQEIARNWAERHGRATALKERLSSLEQVQPALPAAAVSSGDAEVERLWDTAMALLDLEGGKAARPVLEQLLAIRPEHVPARFQLGRLLVEDNLAEGVSHLLKAMDLDEQCVPNACALLHSFYRFTGQTDELRKLDVRMDHYEKALAASQAERREVSASDTFIAHGLGEAELRALQTALAAEPTVLRAALVRKELRHFPSQRLFVLCVHPRRPWHRFVDHEAERGLVNRLSKCLQLPGRLVVVSAAGSFRALARKLSTLPGVEVFRRAKM